MNKLAIILALIILIPSVSAAPMVYPNYPVNADAAYPIDVFANVTSATEIYSDGYESDVKISYIDRTGTQYYESMELISGNETNGTWYYSIPPQQYKCTLDIWIIATDISGTSTRVPDTGGITINIEGPEPAKPFPWGIVLTVAFLGIALVATELIFKPGFYRPTGRQKAAKLEEEDRKKELNENK